MISYLIDFINHNLAIVMLISIACILLSLVSKNVRKNISCAAITGLIPFSIALMHKFGLGLNILYSVLEKQFYLFSELLGKLQVELVDKKDVFLFITNVENEIGKVSFSFLHDLETTVYIVLVDLISVIHNAKLKIERKIVNIKEQIVIRTNLSKFSYCFRV